MTLAYLLHVGVSTVVNTARSRLSFERGPSCLVVSGHSSTQTCVRALIDQSTRLVGPHCSLSCLHFFWHSFIGCRSRLFIARTDVLVLLHFGFVRPAFELRTKWCTLHATHGVVLTIFGVIYLHRSLSPHAPEDLGNFIDDLQLRNLHGFWQSRCSTHVRLHFRIVGACVWLLNLFSLLCQRIHHVCASSALWTVCVGVDLAVRHNSPVDELVFVQHVRNTHRRHLPLLHLINLHVFLDGLD